MAAPQNGSVPTALSWFAAISLPSCIRQARAPTAGTTGVSTDDPVFALSFAAEGSIAAELFGGALAWLQAASKIGAIEISRMASSFDDSSPSLTVSQLARLSRFR